MQNKNIVIGILALIIALGAGYAIGASINRYDNDDYGRGGMHMMPNGQMMGDNSMQGMMMDMNAALVGKTGDSFDRAFLAEMIVHHQGAVEMAELALKNAKHQEIKDLATAIIAAQNKEIADMKAWEKTWYGK
jgi:uncharacterized protein (DUF305 family)